MLADATPIPETIKAVHYRSHEGVEFNFVKQERDLSGLHGSELEGLCVFQASNHLHHADAHEQYSLGAADSSSFIPCIP